MPVRGARTLAVNIPAMPRTANAAGAPAMDAPVDLDLRRVPLKDAVARLAQGTGLNLQCSSHLAERKVTLVLRQRPAGEVIQALARAVSATWSREEDALVLRAGDPMQVLDGREMAAGLRLALWVLPKPREDQVLPTLESTMQSLAQTLQTRGEMPMSAVSPQGAGTLAYLLHDSVRACFLVTEMALEQIGNPAVEIGIQRLPNDDGQEQEMIVFRGARGGPLVPLKPPAEPTK